MAEPVVRAEGLAKRFGPRVALDGLSLDVRRGEVFGLLGHNGAGKTTTVRVLNGVVAPDAGRAEVLGLSPRDEGPALRRRTGVLTETPAADERLTGRENLAFAADVFGVDDPGGRADRLLREFDLHDAADARVSGYSKGMRQRLALARTLLHDPEVLFLDEPTSGLDPVAARQAHERIERMARHEGRTILLCTHNLAEAQRLCDRVAVVRRGRVVALGAPGEVAGRRRGPPRVDVGVAPGQEEAALAALQGVAGLGEAARAGPGRLTLAADEARVPDAVAALVRAGVRVHRVAPEERSLEEAYLELEREDAA